MSHYRKLENMYHGAPVRLLYGNTLIVEEGRAVTIWTVDEKFFHAAGSLHGSAYFRLLDDSAFFAAASLVEDVFIFTADFYVQFLKPVTSGVLTAEGIVTSQGPKRIEVESVLKDENGDVVGKGRGTFARSKIPLSEEMGYKM